MQTQENIKKILVVDDDPKTVDLISAQLKKKGYYVTTANNGVEAYAKAMVQKFDLILLDVLMPIMGGYEFKEEMKVMPEINNIPVLFMSGYVHTSNTIQGEDIVNFLSKPFDSQTLLDRIEKCLKS